MSVTERNCKESLSSLQGVQTHPSTVGRNACLESENGGGKKFQRSAKIILPYRNPLPAALRHVVLDFKNTFRGLK